MMTVTRLHRSRLCLPTVIRLLFTTSHSQRSANPRHRQPSQFANPIVALSRRNSFTRSVEKTSPRPDELYWLPTLCQATGTKLPLTKESATWSSFRTENSAGEHVFVSGSPRICSGLNGPCGFRQRQAIRNPKSWLTNTDPRHPP